MNTKRSGKLFINLLTVSIVPLFLLGANESLLPSAVSGGGIFTDRERREMMDSGLSMAPDDLMDTLNQEFYLQIGRAHV